MKIVTLPTSLYVGDADACFKPSIARRRKVSKSGTASLTAAWKSYRLTRLSLKMLIARLKFRSFHQSIHYSIIQENPRLDSRLLLLPWKNLAAILASFSTFNTSDCDRINWQFVPLDSIGSVCGLTVGEEHHRTRRSDSAAVGALIMKTRT
ncbi:hypothetical protein Bca4012_060215 [Brassica carinata]